MFTPSDITMQQARQLRHKSASRGLCVTWSASYICDMIASYMCDINDKSPSYNYVYGMLHRTSHIFLEINVYNQILVRCLHCPIEHLGFIGFRVVSKLERTTFLDYTTLTHNLV